MKLRDIETALPLAQRLLTLRKVRQAVNSLVSPASFEVRAKITVGDVSETIVVVLPVEEKQLAQGLVVREIQELEAALAALGVEV